MNARVLPSAVPQPSFHERLQGSDAEAPRSHGAAGRRVRLEDQQLGVFSGRSRLKAEKPSLALGGLRGARNEHDFAYVCSQLGQPLGRFRYDEVVQQDTRSGLGIEQLRRVTEAVPVREEAVL